MKIKNGKFLDNIKKEFLYHNGKKEAFKSLKKEKTLNIVFI
jgi:hypothetical protein